MNRRNISFLACLAFFIMIAVTTTVCVLVYAAISEMQSWRIAVIMLIVVFCLSLVCVAVEYLRRRFIVERISDEISAAASLMAKGNFDIRLAPRHTYQKYDEYDRIMDNLNTLAEELSKMEMLRNDFISNVSHEIKTPLSVISNYAAALKKGGVDGATRAKYLDTLINASSRLSSLVTNILKLNKLENSAILSDECEFELGEQLRECIIGFEELIDKKQLELECEIDDMVIYSDKSFLETVWNNLLSNAVKFTPEGGKISVSLSREGDRAKVCVSDTGCGMDSATGAHIFDKFYQGDTSHSGEGNGLGLAMVKRVIEILGGEISVSSELGKGSTFTVKLKGLKNG